MNMRCSSQNSGNTICKRLPATSSITSDPALISNQSSSCWMMAALRVPVSILSHQRNLMRATWRNGMNIRSSKRSNIISGKKPKPFLNCCNTWTDIKPGWELPKKKVLPRRSLHNQHPPPVRKRHAPHIQNPRDPQHKREKNQHLPEHRFFKKVRPGS